MITCVLQPCAVSTISLSEGADNVGGQLRGDKECLFSGVTSSGRVWLKVRKSGTQCAECTFSGVTSSGRIWRKVPESDARSVMSAPFSGVTNSDRVWRKVPESDAQSVLSASSEV